MNDTQYYFDNKDIVKKRHRNLKIRCRKKNIPFNYHLKDFRLFYAHAKNECGYCEKVFPKEELEVDKMDCTQGYCHYNVVMCCPRCNRVKSNVFSYQEMKEIAQKYNLKNR